MHGNEKLLLVVVSLVIILGLATLLSATGLVLPAGNTSPVDKAEANWWIQIGIIGGLILLMIIFSITSSLYDVVCSSCQWRGKYLRWKQHGGSPRCHGNRFYKEQIK
jgi:hypothetical protein